uniref:NADH-ubiquinone oxidoreductase chain 6 n=1 Tax=Gryllus lineaticeps TaxID=128158 RepID=A0A7T8E4Y4_9ORTH|nr:NADH dehydrogenase subunit 6 [Gryllus lineaticeps]QQO79793.1 NADH dehydrogenase subunit 6 [Gryllus lineaticeps]
MYLLMFTMMMLMINSFFIMMNHPLAITLLIIIQTLMICIMTGSISYSFWFSYILFLIFLGGMLVLFIYITSLASNEMFQLPMKTMITNFMISTTIILITINMYNHMMSFHLYKNDSFMNKIINITMENNNLNQLYNYPNFILTIITITYLLITLIIIVKITSFQEGPLRQSN